VTCVYSLLVEDLLLFFFCRTLESDCEGPVVNHTFLEAERTFDAGALGSVLGCSLLAEPSSFEPLGIERRIGLIRVPRSKPLSSLPHRCEFRLSAPPRAWAGLRIP